MKGDRGALEALGWDEARDAEFSALAIDGAVPARIAVEHKSQYEVLAAKSDFTCALTGRMRHEAASRAELPAVGDWVAALPPAGDGLGTIQALLPRRSQFTRQVAGGRSDAQLVAANIDVVFLMTSLTDEFNPRRLERYLALAWDSGAAPCIVLSKADLCADPAPYLAAASAVAAGVPAHLVSAVTGQGVAEVAAEVGAGRTGALLGSSGVGKSTFINALIGQDRLATGEVRAADGKGRHTTTWRELVRLPGGGLLIDTPGMRELQLGDATEGMLDAFADVQALASSCRFTDCTHSSEPGCAVLAAVADGALEPGRLTNFHKMRAELAFLERRDDAAAAAKRKQSDRVANKALQKRLRDKGHTS